MKDYTDAKAWEARQRSEEDKVNVRLRKEMGIGPGAFRLPENPEVLPPPGSMAGVMTMEHFIDVWNDKELRQYIIDMVRRKTKSIDLREDLLQEAWLAISGCKPELACEYYGEVARRAIHRCYMQERRYWEKKKHLRKMGGWRKRGKM